MPALGLSASGQIVFFIEMALLRFQWLLGIARQNYIVRT